MNHPGNSWFHQHIAAWADKTPDATALVYETQQLSYLELHQRVNCLARYLRQQGVTPDQPVGLFVARSFEMVIGILGILRAGGAYVPLEPGYPAERLRFMLQDCGAAHVLTSAHLCDTLSPLVDPTVTVLCLDRDWETITQVAAACAETTTAVSDQNLAYILYTSGSTGRPKGVLLEHRALANRIDWMADQYGLTPEDRVLQKTPFSFDVSGWEFFWPLMCGARLVLIPPEKHKDPHYLRDVITHAGITTLHFVPSMLNAFLSIEGVTGCTSLRQVFCSGEALTPSHTRRFFETLPHCELHNLYGPTEAAIDVTYQPCRPAMTTVPIGKAIRKIQLHIVDATMNPVAHGEAGELCIAGVGLARGYCNRPDLSADRFRPNPFADTPGDRLYHTGDRARFLDDGSIEYLGRMDHQIKLRGNRIELGEIEQVMREQAGVGDAAVVVQEDARGEQRLVAWFSPDPRCAGPVQRGLALEAEGLLEGKRTTTLPNGMDIVHLNPGETDFLYREIYEGEGYLKHGLTVNAGDCVFDVGANIGLFSLNMAQRGAVVHAFEPIPEVYEILALNSRRHGDAVQTYARGIAETSGYETFTYYPNVTILSGAHANLEEELDVVRTYLTGADDQNAVDADEVDAMLRARLETREVRCRISTISEVIAEQGIKTIDLLKVDVEKMEQKVLDGIDALDWPKIRQVVIEVHDHDNRASAVRDLLEQHGFHVVMAQDEALRSTQIYNLYATRTPEAQPKPAQPLETRWYGREALVASIQAGLADRLPDYMLPAAVVPLAALPLTANGKLDRKQLRTRKVCKPRPKTIALPRSEVEEQMLEIWEDLLGIMDLSVDDGFFEAGGNSLLAITLIERINRTFGCALTTTTLFKHASIAALSTHLAEPTPAVKTVAEARVPAPSRQEPEVSAEHHAYSDVEAALNRHPAVRESAVLALARRGKQYLVAHVRPNFDWFRGQEADQDTEELLKNWIPIWEQNYAPILGGEESSDEVLNAIGYVTSDSGDQIPEEEIRECVDLAVGHVMDHQPRNMLEIGCGSGMLLFNLADKVDHYYATDLSENAVAHIHNSLKNKPYRDRVTCIQGDASNLADVPVEAVDTVMIHSVIQYFPGIDYLTDLIRTLTERLPHGARIFIGDVRDLRLLTSFHAAVLAHQCPPDTTQAKFARMLSDRVRLEKELVIDPLYFKNLTRSLLRIKQVRICPKKGRFHNEFTKYRFDAFLYLDEPRPEGAAPRVERWQGESSQATMAKVTGSAETLWLTDVPNRRLWREQALLEWTRNANGEATLQEALARIDATPDADKGVDPYWVLQQGNQAGVTTTVHWEHPHQHGHFDIYVQPAGQSPGEPPHALTWQQEATLELDGANFPGFSVVWQEKLGLLKYHLSEHLPPERVPARFIFQTDLPKDENGRIDRAVLSGERAVPTAQPPATQVVPQQRNRQAPVPADSLAIIGISCQVPGADNHTQFWQNLCAGVESVTMLSQQELIDAGVAEARRTHPNFVPAQRSITNKDGFDPGFFNISPRNALYMDPQTRLLLLHSWLAVEDAGYAIDDLSDTGVFMSTAANFYPLPLGLSAQELQGADGHPAGLQAQGGMVANTISYHLGLKGPSLFVQSLCSSSLVGVKLAAQSLLTGETKTALVGGAGLFAFSRAGYLHEPDLNLSADGKCRSFDADATGMVEGEGVCVVLLKKATDAVADGDPIYALLRGISVNNDGNDKAGFHAPGVLGQAAAARQVLAKTGIDPQSIGYIEAHGTGTPSGDAIEVAALNEAYAGAGRQQCALGSVKPNIGNLDTAGGLAGLIKVVMALHHGTVPPQINFDKAAPDLALADSPFFIATPANPWPAGKPLRRAAQNHYSLGGTNVHAIFEAAPPNPVSSHADHPVLVPLSAQDDNRLREAAKQLATFLEHQPDTSVRDLAYTLQIGRVAMKQRVAFLARNRAELRDLLGEFVAGRAHKRILCGTIQRKEQRLFDNDEDARALLQGWLQKGRLAKIAELWLKGVAMAWPLLYGDNQPRRIHLPGYPFARQPFWIPETPAATTPPPPVVNQTPPAQSERTDTTNAALQDPITTVLKAIASDLLMVDAADLDPHCAFNDCGFDSVALIQFTNRLNEAYRLDLKPTALFENPSIARLSHYLADRYAAVFGKRFSLPVQNRAPRQAPPNQGQRQTAPTAQTGMPSRPSPGGETPIAIVGMSGCFPGARDLQAFWENLRDGKDCIREIPADRWDWRAIDGDPREDKNKTRVHWGGFIDGVAEFDPLFFGISPREAASMDPQNRLLMTHVWLAMEDAGHSAQSLAGGDTGIFVGTGETGYARLLQNTPDVEDYAFLGLFPFGGPNRMSFFLDLHGPSEPINTGCSSSLVAVHKAVTAIREGRCGMAFAGGVNTVPTPDGHISFSRAGMLCEDGRCKAFSAEANGFVRGEGVAMLLLKPLAEAERDGNPIYAVIRGSAENHGGRANSFTAPNPKAQAALLAQAYRQAGIAPDRVGYIETHGTGTHLGDPIEIEGLQTAFRALGAAETQRSTCGLGAVKSNIGHSEMAAGIAGLVKTVLQLKHRTLAKSLHCETVNPYIQLEESPFFIVQETQPWPALQDETGRDLPRVAGVSSFGIGGVNAHVVLEEYTPTPTAPTATPDQVLIVLSAKNETRLRESAANLCHFLDQLSAQPQQDPGLLADLAYTLQVGREPMEERLAFTVTTLDELRERLAGFSAKRPQGIFQSGTKAFRDALTLLMSDEDIRNAIDTWITKKKYAQLIQLWVRGLPFDWERLYSDQTQRPRRIHLPGYPFARERYWIQTDSRETANPLTEQADLVSRNPTKPTPIPAKPAPLTQAKTEDPFFDRRLTTQWLDEPLPTDIHWRSRLQAKAGNAITVIYDETQRRDELVTLLYNLEEAAGLDQPLLLETVSVRHVANGISQPDVILFLGPAPSESNKYCAKAADQLTQVIEQLHERAWFRPLEVYYLYEGAPTPASEALCGMMQAAMHENPRHQWTLIGHGDDAEVTAGQRLLTEWVAGGAKDPGEPRVIRHQAGRRLVRRTVSVPVAAGSLPFASGDTWLITGSFEEDPALLRHLAARYQPTLVFLFRGAWLPARERCYRELEQLGATLHRFAADGATPLRDTYTRIKHEVGPLQGVLDVAGGDDSGARPSAGQRRALRAACSLLTELQQLTADENLAFFSFLTTAATKSDAMPGGYPTAFRLALAEQMARRGDAAVYQRTATRDAKMLEKTWKVKQVPEEQAGIGGTILIIVNPHSHGLAKRMFQRSDRVVFAGCDDAVTYPFDPDNRESGRAAAARILAEREPIALLLDLGDLTENPCDTAAVNFGKLAFYQVLVGAFTPMQINYVTAGLQPFRAEHMSLAGARFAGLVKMLSAEYRHINARCIDIDAALATDPRAFENLVLRECRIPLEETEICYRHGVRYVPTLVVTDPPRLEAAEIAAQFPITRGGVYVVSGGTRGIGLEIARYLIDRGARRLVLMGVTPLPERALWPSLIREQDPQQTRLAPLQALADQLDVLEIYTGPLTADHDLTRFFQRVRRQHGAIKGVVHSAGVYADLTNSAFVTRNLDDVASIVQPKVDGMIQLARLFNDELDFFVSFSSLTSFVPLLARGISDYAMANAFLDFFSAWQHHHQRTWFRAITWVDWNETGVAKRMSPEEFALVEQNLARVGLSSFSNEEGRRFFEQAMMVADRHHVLPAFVDGPALHAAKPTWFHGVSRDLQQPAPTVRPFVKTPAAKAPIAETPANRPAWNLEDRIAQWEQAGKPLAIETLTRYVSFDQLKQQDPVLIQRVYQLLYPDETHPAAEVQELSPSEPDPLARTVYETLLDVLKIKHIEPHEPFADYGLDSISAMVFSTRLEKRLDIEIPPQCLIDFPTIHTLSEHLKQAGSSERNPKEAF